jgi:hypothetical protein
VVKFNNNLQGANLPFNESVAREIYHACKLEVPSWKPLLVTDAFLEQNPFCWLQTQDGHLRPESGICFGSRFLGGEGVRLLEILPGPSLKRVHNHEDFWLAWLIDICARNADNRQAIFVEDADSGLKAHFIDNGHFFGGPKGELCPHFLASRYLDPRIYQNVSSQQVRNFLDVAGSIDADRIWHQAELLPDNWKTASAIEALTQCLMRLATPNLLRNILETMVDANQRANGERKEFNPGRKPPASVLCTGIPGLESGEFLVANDDRYPACVRR